MFLSLVFFLTTPAFASEFLKCSMMDSAHNEEACISKIRTQVSADGFTFMNARAEAETTHASLLAETNFQKLSVSITNKLNQKAILMSFGEAGATFPFQARR